MGRREITRSKGPCSGTDVPHRVANWLLCHGCCRGRSQTILSEEYVALGSCWACVSHELLGGQEISGLPEHCCRKPVPKLVS